MKSKRKLILEFMFFNKISYTIFTKRTLNYLYMPNRLSSTIGGNREMDQLYTTSQVSYITRKTKCSHIS